MDGVNKERLVHIPLPPSSPVKITECGRFAWGWPHIQSLEVNGMNSRSCVFQASVTPRDCEQPHGSDA